MDSSNKRKWINIKKLKERKNKQNKPNKTPKPHKKFKTLFYARHRP